MGKLGKKARKFAHKNLQSVQRMKRKKNSFFKRKALSHKNPGTTEDSQLLEKPTIWQSDGIANDEIILNNFLDTSSDEDNDELVEDSSDSDGFLSEDFECPYISDKEDENIFGDKCDHSALVEQNKQLATEIEEHKKKLERLLKTVEPLYFYSG